MIYHLNRSESGNVPIFCLCAIKRKWSGIMIHGHTIWIHAYLQTMKHVSVTKSHTKIAQYKLWIHNLLRRRLRILVAKKHVTRASNIRRSTTQFKKQPADEHMTIKTLYINILVWISPVNIGIQNSGNANNTSQGTIFRRYFPFLVG